MLLVMSKVTFSQSLSAEYKMVVGQTSIDVLASAADVSNNALIMITSTLRPPSRQAQAMYDNLSRGIRINYAAPGRDVTALYDSCVKAGKDKVATIAAMTNRINELAQQGKLVSKHCVTAEQYAKVNVIDISKNIPNPRDMVRALSANQKVLKVIAPFHVEGMPSKVIYDKSESAIHVEIGQ